VTNVRQDLVYDVGLHRGEDTDFYLRKGYRVIGIEAHPGLVANAAIRFQEAITDGRLHIVSGAIAPKSAGNKLNFYANRDQSVWGTIIPEWKSRNDRLGSPSDQISVNRIEIIELYRTYGIPFYLKVDIEGVDCFVLEQLRAFEDRPQYVSLESEKIDFGQLTAEMELLKGLGYGKFQVVQQETIPGTKIVSATLDGEGFEYVFEAHSSGPFGDDLPSPWLSYDEALELYKMVFRRYNYFGDYSVIRKMPELVQKTFRKLYKSTTGYKGPWPGWYDTHASL
jgi:FkbM family methyltransferase